MWRLLALLLLPTACDSEQSCEEAREEHLVHVRSHFESCGIDPALIDESKAADCTEEIHAIFICSEECMHLASCDMLKGLASGEQYDACIIDCHADLERGE